MGMGAITDSAAPFDSGGAVCADCHRAWIHRLSGRERNELSIEIESELRFTSCGGKGLWLFPFGRTKFLKIAGGAPGSFVRMKLLLSTDVSTQRPHARLRGLELVRFNAFLLSYTQIIKRKRLGLLTCLGVKTKLVDVELERIRREHAAVREFVVNDLIARRRFIHPVEATGKRERPNLQLKLFF